MPFTPFHLGPALCLGIPLRNYIHVPTFILANVILDIEPLIVMLLRLPYPLHGYLHTFVAAVGIGLVFGLIMFFLERSMHPLYKRLLLESQATLKKSQFLSAGVLGTILHVLFDAPLYYDIKPFYPLTVNPLSSWTSYSEIYSLSAWMGILGIIFCSLLIVWTLRARKNQEPFRSTVNSEPKDSACVLSSQVLNRFFVCFHIRVLTPCFMLQQYSTKLTAGNQD